MGVGTAVVVPDGPALGVSMPAIIARCSGVAWDIKSQNCSGLIMVGVLRVLRFGVGFSVVSMIYTHMHMKI